MNSSLPRFLLFSEVSLPHAGNENECRQGEESPQGKNCTQSGPPPGRWRFVLEAVDGAGALEATDDADSAEGDRSELWAIVRGLEALEQPSRVTLLTASQYVSAGLRSGLNEWRDSNWQWERFGSMVPIKNDDLWKRVDRALQFHQVECRTWRSESSGPLLANSETLAAALGKVDSHCEMEKSEPVLEAHACGEIAKIATVLPHLSAHLPSHLPGHLLGRKTMLPAAGRDLKRRRPADSADAAIARRVGVRVWWRWLGRVRTRTLNYIIDTLFATRMDNVAKVCSVVVRRELVSGV